MKSKIDGSVHFFIEFSLSDLATRSLIGPGIIPLSYLSDILKSMNLKIKLYKDYRDFLKAKFINDKIAKAASQEKRAKEIGISKAFLSMVLKKERHLHLNTLPAVWKAFHLNEREQICLTYLFCYSIAEDPRLKKHFEVCLQSFTQSE